jgi:hypothetical protein
MADSKTYPLPHPEQVAAKIKAAGGPAIDLSKPSGEASADGITLAWTMQPDAYVQVTIVKKPFYIPASTIWSHADALFAGN